MVKSFDYDVAFSFLGADEALATRLADRLEGRKAFVYSRAQEQLAGRDGEIAFAEVFKSKARVVVVLMRDGWGETPFTRVEETAIRGRAYDEGYDFCLMVPVEGAKVPIWFPRNRLWIGLERWGEQNAAAVIEARCQEAGGEPVVPSFAERAAREERAVRFAEHRNRWLAGEGVAAADEAYSKLADALVEATEVLKTASPSLEVSYRRNGRRFSVYASRPGVSVAWQRPYSNTLSESTIYVDAWEGAPPFPGIMTFGSQTPVRTFELLPDLGRDGQPCWVLRGDGDDRQLSSSAAADYIMRWWLDGPSGRHATVEPLRI